MFKATLRCEGRFTEVLLNRGLFGTFDALLILLGRAGIEVNKQDSGGKTALLLLLQNRPDDNTSILDPISALRSTGGGRS